MIDLTKSAGIVTLNNWVMMPNGGRYTYVWAQNWEILTDRQVGEHIDGFRSTEHWQLAAKVGYKYVIIIPGCVVKGWVRAEKPVDIPECYIIGKNTAE